MSTLAGKVFYSFAYFFPYHCHWPLPIRRLSDVRKQHHLWCCFSSGNAIGLHLSLPVCWLPRLYRDLVHRLGPQQHGHQPERLQQPTNRREFKLEFKPGRQSQSLTERVLVEFARIFWEQSLIHDAVASTATIHFTA